jgi:hypothetical protein
VDSLTTMLKSLGYVGEQSLQLDEWQWRSNMAIAVWRFVAELVEFVDPGGNRLEIFWGPYLDNEAFKP